MTEQKDKLRHATKAGSRCCGCCVAATAKAHPQGGTITTLKDGVATAYRAYDKTRDMREVASVEAVRRLADDVDAMLDQLTDRLAAQASAVAP